MICVFVGTWEAACVNLYVYIPSLWVMFAYMDIVVQSCWNTSIDKVLCTCRVCRLKINDITFATKFLFVCFVLQGCI